MGGRETGTEGGTSNITNNGKKNTPMGTWVVYLSARYIQKQSLIIYKHCGMRTHLQSHVTVVAPTIGRVLGAVLAACTITVGMSVAGSKIR